MATGALTDKRRSTWPLPPPPPFFFFFNKLGLVYYKDWKKNKFWFVLLEISRNGKSSYLSYKFFLEPRMFWAVGAIVSYAKKIFSLSFYRQWKKVNVFKMSVSISLAKSTILVPTTHFLLRYAFRTKRWVVLTDHTAAT